MNQFGVHDPNIINQPLNTIDDFYVAWHLFQRSYFFNFCTGLIEIIGGILLIFNRTKLIGALIILSVLIQIFIIDVAFTTNVFGASLPLRIGGMILSDLVILYFYRKNVILSIRSLTKNIKTKIEYKWWIYPILILAGIMMDFIIALISYPIKLLINLIG